MMKIPSKTYLLGEYIVLDRAPCLILNTPPYFEVNIKKNNPRVSHKNCFHPESSAGLWLQKNADFFKDKQIDFFDPHKGKGGFGASSAEFIAVYAAQHGIKKNINWLEKLLEDYWSLLKPTHNILPSGADLIAQVSGVIESEPPLSSKMIYWHRAKKQLENLSWSFPDLSYCLIRSGYKCPTHQNIKKISSSIVTEMSKVVDEGYLALQSKNAGHFVDAIKNYADWMKKEGCLFAKTEELIQLISRSGLIEAAKGCGALGADVVLVLIHSEKMPTFLSWLEEREITPVY